MKNGPGVLSLAVTALLFSACGKEWPEEASVVRGATAPDTELRFDCDDGKVYRTRTLSFGANSRFSLSLPHGATCRLSLRRKHHSWESVLFHDGRNQSPLIYLKSTRINLGPIEMRANGPRLLLGDDDTKLVATPVDLSSPLSLLPF